MRVGAAMISAVAAKIGLRFFAIMESVTTPRSSFGRAVASGPGRCLAGPGCACPRAAKPPVQSAVAGGLRSQAVGKFTILTMT
jgi:hypothetical protein